MRGKPAISCPNFSCIRITPAGAGKTNTVAVTRTVKRDHPRRCGENYVAPCLFCKLKGSPPQVRGKRLLCRAVVIRTGITPAGAGKTSLPIPQLNPARDHPRRCGENVVRYPTNTTYSGITPAGAGKTFHPSAHVSVAQDHPRRCGENIPRIAVENPVGGSPPQVRGKLYASTMTY